MSVNGTISINSVATATATAAMGAWRGICIDNFGDGDGTSNNGMAMMWAESEGFGAPPIWTEFSASHVLRIYSYAYRKY